MNNYYCLGIIYVIGSKIWGWFIHNHINLGKNILSHQKPVNAWWQYAHAHLLGTGQHAIILGKYGDIPRNKSDIYAQYRLTGRVRDRADRMGFISRIVILSDWTGSVWRFSICVIGLTLHQSSTPDEYFADGKSVFCHLYQMVSIWESVRRVGILIGTIMITKAYTVNAAASYFGSDRNSSCIWGLFTYLTIFVTYVTIVNVYRSLQYTRVFCCEPWIQKTST